MRVWDQEPTACYIQARSRADDFIFLPLVHRNSASKHAADFISAFKKRHLLPFFRQQYHNRSAGRAASNDGDPSVLLSPRF